MFEVVFKVLPAFHWCFKVELFANHTIQPFLHGALSVLKV